MVTMYPYTCAKCGSPADYLTCSNPDCEEHYDNNKKAQELIKEDIEWNKSK